MYSSGNGMFYGCTNPFLPSYIKGPDIYVVVVLEGALVITTKSLILGIKELLHTEIKAGAYFLNMAGLERHARLLKWF